MENEKLEPPLPEIVLALSDLEVRLGNDLMKVPPADYDHDARNADRDRFIALLTEIDKFFTAIGHRKIENDVFSKVAREVYRLTLALHDLDAGTVADCLQPVRKTGRAADQSIVWRARASVAAAVECFFSLGGDDRKSVGRMLAKHKALLSLLRSNSSIEDAPFNWLEQFKSGKVVADSGARAWEACIEKIEPFKNCRGCHPDKIAGLTSPELPDWHLVGNWFLNIAIKQAKDVSGISEARDETPN